MSELFNHQNDEHDITVSMGVGASCGGGETLISIQPFHHHVSNVFEGKRYGTRSGTVTLHDDGARYALAGELCEDYMPVGIQLAKEIIALKGLRSALVIYNSGETSQSYTVLVEYLIIEH